MTLVALDATKLIVLMVAGGGFALAGLWLMFRPKPEGGAAKLELFGAKFEALSAGLLVFLIGAGFLAIPLVVPERAARPAPDAAGESSAGPKEAASAPDETSAVILPAAAGSKEAEPNNFLTEANQIGRSIFYSGATSGNRDDADDWFVLPTTDADGEEIEVQLRARAGTCYLSVHDSKEQLLDKITVYSVDTGYLTTEKRGAFLLIRVSDSGQCRYELRAG